MRKVIERKAKDTNIQKRIDLFIEKLTKINDNKSKVNACVRNELRWLGVESEKPKYSVGTIRSYLTKYRQAVAASQPFHSGALDALRKLNKEFKGKLDLAIQKPTTPLEVMNKVQLIMSLLEDKTDGLYDKLLKIKIAHQAYYLLKIKKGQSALLKDSQRKTVARRKRKPIEISRDAVIGAVKEGLASGQKYKTLIALSLCSGRRPLELYKTGSFAEVKNNNHALIFEGQAKKKHGKTAENYEIPILHVSSKEFLKAFKEFRKMIGDTSQLTPVQVNGRITSDVSNTVRKMLYSEDSNLYTCRAIYANWIADNNTEKDRDIVMSEILGHEADDVMTAKSYQGVKLTGATIEEVKENYKKESNKSRKKDLAVGRKKDAKKIQTAAKTQDKKSEKQLRRLEKLQQEAEKLGRAVSNINRWAILYVENEGYTDFTQTMVSKQLGANRQSIKKWLNLFH